MGKTRRNVIREGICCGSNTEFYRQRRKRQRRINSQRLKTAANSLDVLEDFNDIEAIDDVEYLHMPKRDDYREPTDGTILIEKEDLKNYNNPHISKRQYDKLQNTLKPKHYKH